jgi:hypothetical protein
MAKLRNLKDIIKVPTIVKVKNVFNAEVDNYGKNRKNSIVSLNNEDLYATFKEKDFDKAVVGNQLMANPKMYKDAPYIEWFEAPNSNNFTPNDLPFKQEMKDPVKDERGEQIHRAQMVNCAIAMGMREQEKIVELAEQLRLGKVGDYILKNRTTNAQVTDYTEPKIDIKDLPF